MIYDQQFARNTKMFVDELYCLKERYPTELLCQIFHEGVKQNIYQGKLQSSNILPNDKKAQVL